MSVGDTSHFLIKEMKNFGEKSLSIESAWIYRSDPDFIITIKIPYTYFSPPTLNY